MTNQPQTHSQAAQGDDHLSALADGRLHGDEFTAALGRIAAEPSALSQWHAYHVVGDVLRSPDLSGAAGDMAFLERFEARLRAEPVRVQPPLAQAAPVVAPLLRPAANADLFRWKMAAGFASLAAVAAIGWQALSLPSPQQGGGALLAQDSRSSQAGEFRQVRADIAAAPETMSSPGNPPVMLRNAQLDELLAAHTRAVGGAALQSQIHLLRNVSVTEDFSR